MTVVLGVDTGGTYSDAVLLQDGTTILATAKSLTTPDDLSIGIGRAVASVLHQANVSPDQITMVSLSTTLATNALVEGHGGRVALVLLGFPDRTLSQHGLPDALQDGPSIAIPGGHDHSGAEAAPLDLPALKAFAARHQDVTAFAAAGMFATRNSAHETRAAQVITALTGRPVTCSHQLSANLNGPKRALTALLNARLVGLIDQLIISAQGRLAGLGITAPLMVVRGDGALISAQTARAKPIETILSGPAASLVGARWLSGAQTAMVSDIGGTTTDIGILQDGRPALDPDGAEIGGFRTMVEAVAMRTFGLGGDSQVRIQTEGLEGGILLGPQRALPICALAQSVPDSVLSALEAQLRSPYPNPHDGCFVIPAAVPRPLGLGPRETALLDRIDAKICPVATILRTRIDHATLAKLRAKRLVQIAALTPTDAAHALGLSSQWDPHAATLALKLAGRQRTGAGTQYDPDPHSLAQRIVDALREQTALALLEAGFAHDGDAFDLPPRVLARHILTRRGLTRHTGAVRLETALNLPVIGLGASASTYYPEVGTRIAAQIILPEHGDVANALGAVVGQIRARATGTITAPSEGVFRIHVAGVPQNFATLDSALSALSDALGAQASQEAQAAGADGLILSQTCDIKRAEVESREVFIEATVTVEAAGRPRFAVCTTPTA